MSDKSLNGYIILIIFTIIAVTIILILSINHLIKYIDKKYVDLVCQTSKRYKAIEWLNSTYDFHENLKEKYSLHCYVDSKAKYDRFDFLKEFKNEIALRPEQFRHLLSTASKNRKLYKKYVADMSKLPPFTPKDSVFLKWYRFKKYSKIERELCRDELLLPITKFHFYYFVEYTSPAGRNSYNDYTIFDEKEIKLLLYEIEDDLRRKDTSEYQRSIMTPTLRYDVMKRDGFRCVLCGRTADDGIKLHVDHILPVSKGGKTIMSNLRTLCEDCNRGKSDKYDMYGPN